MGDKQNVMPRDIIPHSGYASASLLAGHNKILKLVLVLLYCYYARYMCILSLLRSKLLGEMQTQPRLIGWNKTIFNIYVILKDFPKRNETTNKNSTSCSIPHHRHLCPHHNAFTLQLQTLIHRQGRHVYKSAQRDTQNQCQL